MKNPRKIQTVLTNRVINTTYKFTSFLTVECDRVPLITTPYTIHSITALLQYILMRLLEANIFSIPSKELTVDEKVLSLVRTFSGEKTDF